MLPEIPNVTTIRKGVTRILAQNPGPFTLQGTNTYLIASEKRSVLVDTGEGKSEYLGFLESVLRSQPPVSDIILSHWHHDHVGGLPSVLKLIHKLHSCQTPPQPVSFAGSYANNTFPKVWKFKSSADEPRKHPDQNSQDHGLQQDRNIHQQILETFRECVSNSTTSPPSDGQAEAGLSWLTERQAFQLSDDLKLEILHTPGHTDDSISCLLYEGEEEGPSGVLVGDMILGGSSTIFEDLVVYLNSLQKLLSHVTTSTSPSKIVPLYPAHGSLIQDGAQSIQKFITHRLDREKQILETFRLHFQNASPADPDYYLTAERLVELIYPKDLPKQVIPAAIHGINQHLYKLKHDGFIDQLETDPGSWFLKIVTTH